MEIFKNFLTLIFPNRCPFCKKVISKKEYSCEKCKKDFPEISYRTVTLNAFQNVSPFPYSNQYRKAVLNFKFHQKKYYYRSLGYYTSLTVAKEYGDKEFDIVTSVPMHKNGLKFRKYNHAELLAKAVSEFLDIPYEETLVKVKDNKKQHTLNAKDRAKNVLGVYKVIDSRKIKGKNILIIDDIITTGSTLGECCKALKNKDAERIFCATVCTSVYKTY